MSDLIRRSDAIKAIANLHILADEEKIFKVYANNPHSMTTDFEGTLIDAINAIKGIPTIEPKKIPVANIHINTEELLERIKEEYELEPKQGKWIKTTPWSYGSGMGEVYGYYQKCSNCGKEFMDKSNFCPNCGARMKGAGNDLL